MTFMVRNVIGLSILKPCFKKLSNSKKGLPKMIIIAQMQSGKYSLINYNSCSVILCMKIIPNPRHYKKSYWQSKIAYYIFYCSLTYHPITMAQRGRLEM